MLRMSHYCLPDDPSYDNVVKRTEGVYSRSSRHGFRIEESTRAVECLNVKMSPQFWKRPYTGNFIKIPLLIDKDKNNPDRPTKYYCDKKENCAHIWDALRK